jgi:dTDP-4-dehydrorhamnose 3,5-epimerase
MIKITETGIPGLLVIEPRIFPDARGYFYESYNERVFRENGLDFRFVQDNESRSVRDVVRGLHYQLEPHAQTKLLRVLEGSILDVVVDLRKNSPAFGTWSAIELSAENRLQLLVPKGCAHGFRVVSENATVFYKCDEFYYPGSERGLLFSDPGLAIDWGIGPERALVSEKDRNAPAFPAAEINFVYGKV